MFDNSKIIDHILEAEGWPKYTNHPADKGGPTKGGITLRTLRSVQPAAAINDLKLLTEDKARQIYETQYIISPGFAMIKDDLLRWQVVDAGILSGPFQATKWLQEVVKAARDIKIDGVFGPKTAQAVNLLEPHSTGLRFAANRGRGLMRIVSDNPSQSVWAAGWMNRCMSFVLLEAARADEVKGAF